MDEIGGGASRSTDPAAGTSSATDVSLREYVAVRLEALDRFINAEIAALRRETLSAEASAKDAIKVAAHEAEERLAAHNGLIQQMQELQGTFATRESLDAFKSERRHALDDFREANDRRLGRLERFQASLIGGFIFVSFLGVASLVKVFTG